MSPETSASVLSSLSHRARRILYAVVTEYITTGEPVGSRRLARRYGLNLSPASIRNVLADLTDAGLLMQPHTSAGRIPTDRGFRLFVDALVQMREVTAADRAAIEQRIRSLSGPREVLRESGRLLASMTGAAAVVAPPRPDEEPIAHIHFVPLPGERVLAVVVTRSGAVQNRIVPGEGIESADLERAHNLLRELLRRGARSLAELRDALAADLDGMRELRARARSVVDAALAAQQGPPELLVEGQGVLFDRPEFSDPEKLRAFVRAFEEKERLVGLLDRTMASSGVQVLIGAEANVEGVSDISIVTAPIRHGTRTAGRLAVVGPQRLDYGKVVPLVELTASVVGETLGTRRG
ncbi:MAG: heat-inducible transcriptional repressor HrcA [Myxococcales bacterium]|nr:heat-inducible transcriptional repressor HrcA [Myxococcales bacterium]